jgi:predicted alpha-1,2-mannosidase
LFGVLGSRLAACGALILAASACSSSSPTPSAPHDPAPVSTSVGSTGPASLVDVFVGTDDAKSDSPVTNGAGGSTFPGASLPFGMVQLSPDTPNAHPSGYKYSDTSVNDFSLTHLNGAGCSAEHDFPILPMTGPPDPANAMSASFSHDKEIASPGFYEVTLGSGIQVDLTATARTGFLRFTFPKGADEYVTLASASTRDLVISGGFDAAIQDGGLVTGSHTSDLFCFSDSSYKLYFAARFDRAIAESGSWQDGKLSAGSSQVSANNGGLYFRFDDPDRRVVQMKIGLSYVSADAALANLNAENPGWDFDAIHKQAVETWNDYLGRIAIEGGARTQQKGFYTALYHVLLQPEVFGDVDGSFMGFDAKVHSDPGYVRYSNFSGWDIYRSWIQLASVIAPKETSDMMHTLVDAAGECGALPKWPLANRDTGEMVGDPADAILANAYAFGARNFDAKAALKAMLNGATDPKASCDGHVERPDLSEYLALHYCPIDGAYSFNGPTSVTLEYASADFAVAELAGALGDTASKQTYLARGRWWQSVFDPTMTANGFTGYVEPRKKTDTNGQPSFEEEDVANTNGFVEGNSTQYTFMVPQDAYGMAAALGGDETTAARLDALFTQLNAGTSEPNFYMGNEPEFGTPWLYPFVGAASKTQSVVRRIVDSVFSVTPGGLPGNEDLGATSSWLVWAELGLYPAVPGVGGFVVGSPLFPKATITLGNGKTLVITASGAADDAPYVRSLAVNGKPTAKSWIEWSQVSGGGTIAFQLGKQPNTAFGQAAADRPPNAY